MEEIKISRDKKNPTWVWVSDEDVNSHPTDKKRILLDVVDDGCVCVNVYDEDSYTCGKIYTSMTWKYFTIIKEPTYRPFKDDKELIEYCKTIKDMRILRKCDGCIRTITSIGNDHVSKICVCIDLNGWFGLQALFENFTWLDGSPIGVKEEN